MHDDDDDLDEEDDYEESDDPQDADIDDTSDAETLPCPHCGEQVYEQAEKCPWCGEYLTRETSRPKIPWWIIVGALLALVSAFLWIF